MRNRYLLLLDLPLLAIAAFGAFALRFDWIFAQYRPEFATFLVAAVLLKPVVFYVFGMYARYWRYATATDLLAVTLAVSAASVVVVVYVGVGRAVGVVGDFSRSVLLIDWLLTLALVGGVRMSVRVIGETQDSRHRSASSGAKRILIIGAGEAGTMVLREMWRNPQLGMIPVGFVDDDVRKHGKRIYSTIVFGPVADLERVAKLARIDEVVIAMPRASGTVIRAVAERCRLLGIHCRTIPGVFELLDGRVTISRLRQVEISDLLRREEINPRPGSDAYLEGRTVLVTGAGGSIGSEICRQIARARPRKLILLGHGENSIFDVHADIARAFPALAVTPVIADVRDERRIDAAFEQHRPAVVLHAAAHKHVPLMEENAVEAITNNVFGTHVVASAALRYETERFVLISTDKAVAPTSIMGLSKRVAETVVQHLAGRGSTALMIVRFGNVLGSRGSVVPIFKAQIERGGPITITDPEMKRFFMTIPEAVNLVVRAGGLGRGGELFVLNMGSPVRIRDLAEDLIRLSGFSLAEIPIVFTERRPGEKLEETLWEHGALVEPTVDGDILRVTEPVQPGALPVDILLQALHDGVRDGRRSAIEAALASFMPPLEGNLSAASLSTRVIH